MTNPGTIAFLKAVLEASWQGSLVILLILLVRPLLGFRVPARWRCFLWLLVLIRLLAPAFILPRSPASLQNLAVVQRPIEHAQASFDRAYADYVNAGQVGHRESGPEGRAESLPAPVRTPHRAISWWQLCAWVWFGGAVLFAAWIAGAAIRLHRRLRGEDAVVDETVLAIWKRCCSRLSLSRPPRLLMTQLVASPALVGLARPALLIPKRALELFSPEDWEHVLMHELAHYKRRDHWTQALQLLALCVHWFNPLVWMEARFLCADRELATDEMALRALAGDRAAAYGDTLLKVLAGRSPLSLQPGVIGIMDDGTQLKQRLRRIIRFGPRRMLGSAVGLALTIVLAVLVLGRQMNKAEDAKAAPSNFAETKSAKLKADMERLIAGARAGDGTLIRKVVKESCKLGLNEADVKQLGGSLDSLLRSREPQPFTLLLKEWQQTSLGRSWQPDDALLAGLVKESRTDFLDVLLGARLDLKRLQAQQKAGDAKMSAWIARRVAETEHERKDIQTLVEACSKGDVRTVQQLLDAGVNVNSRTSDDALFTPLTRAAAWNQVEIVKLLLKRGADVDLTKIPGSSYTPLCLARSPEVADLLLAAGANINGPQGPDGNIIFYCVTFGPKEMVQWFIDHGVDPKKVKGYEPTLLFDAGTPEIAEILIRNGLDVNAKGEGGRTALFNIEQMVKNPSGVVEILLKHGANPNARTEGGWTPLMSAPDGATVDALVAAGADINAKDDRGDSVLANYVPNADPSRLEALKRHGVKPDAGEGAALLANAINRHKLDEVKMLLQQGVDPKVNVLWEGRPGATPLSCAIRDGEFEIAEILRKAGAKDVGKLSQAAAVGDLKQMQTLIDAGGDVNERSAIDETPLVFAIHRGQVAAVQFLLDHGANVNLFDTWGFNPYVIARLFEENLNERNFSQISGVSPDEARKSINGILPLLRAHNLDLNYRNKDGETALCRAATTGNFIAGIFLPKDGANVNMQRNDRMTPLMLAVVSQPKNAPLQGTTGPGGKIGGTGEKHSENGMMVATFLHSGADLTLKNKDGKTALDLARENGNEEILSLLQEANKAAGPTSTPAASPSAAARGSSARSPSPDAIKPVAALPPATSSESLLAAVRAGDGPLIQRVIEESFKGPGIDEGGATQLLDSLVQSRELKPFALLLKELRQTNLGKNWQPNDALLAGLVKDGRTDFLDALLAERLDLKRLEGDEKEGDATTAAWIARRVAGTQRERDDILKLVDACSKGDAETVRQLLDAGVNVNSRTSDGGSWTPLTKAASANRVEVVRLLLERGAGPDLPHFPGWDYTPLCLTSSVEVANLLKAAGANVHAKLFRRNVSILTYAAESNGAPMVQWFLDQGLDPKMSGDNGEQTLLFDAGTPEVAELLIQHGVDVNAANNAGNTALFGVMLRQRHPAKIVEVLLKHGADPNQRGSIGDTPLMHAPDGETVDVLVNAGADLHAKNDQGDTVLTRRTTSADPSRYEALKRHGLTASTKENAHLLNNAILNNSPDQVKAAIKQGADPNLPAVYEGAVFVASPLVQALCLGHFKVVDALCEAGANNVGHLSMVAATGDLEQMKALIAAGSDVNECDPTSAETPLMFAARCGQVAAARFLLEHGADLNAFDNVGLTANALMENCKFQLDHSPQHFCSIGGKSQGESKKALDALLALFREHKPDTNYRNKDGETALCRAAAAGNSMANELIGDGANVNVQHNDGMTPLMLAVVGPAGTETFYSGGHPGEGGKKETHSRRALRVEELLVSGADVSLKNKDGKTALDLARKEGDQEILALLQKADKAADPASTPANSPSAEASGSSTSSPSPDANKAALLSSPYSNGSAGRQTGA